MKRTDEIEGVVGIGDDPALELLNTVQKVDGELVDSLANDDDVVALMARLGWGGRRTKGLEPMALLHAARRLRKIVRRAVEQRAAGEAVEYAGLNAFLAHGASSVRLVPADGGTMRMERVWGCGCAEEVLGPLAEAAATLLVEADFALVRRCESSECVLWFYDRTKAHRRRWCSMATCGNRHKVAAFRERQR